MCRRVILLAQTEFISSGSDGLIVNTTVTISIKIYLPFSIRFANHSCCLSMRSDTMSNLRFMCERVEITSIGKVTGERLLNLRPWPAIIIYDNNHVKVLWGWYVLILRIGMNKSTPLLMVDGSIFWKILYPPLLHSSTLSRLYSQYLPTINGYSMPIWSFRYLWINMHWLLPVSLDYHIMFCRKSAPNHSR